MATKRWNKTLQLLLVILFMGYYGGTTLFIHSHTIHGEQITHSHPYSTPCHGHTSNQVQQISELSTFHSLDELSLNIIEALLSCIKVEYRCFSEIYRYNDVAIKQLRAPPVFLFMV
jgi:hypothetical protein